MWLRVLKHLFLWIGYFIAMLIVFWILKNWFEFGTDVAILGGMCAVGFIRLSARLDFPPGPSVESQISELWRYIWDPSDVKRMRASSRMMDAVTTALLEKEIRKGMTVDQIFEYFKQNGINDIYLGPGGMGESEKETYERAFWNYDYADPTPAAQNSIPELRLTFRTADKVLLDWKIEYRGKNSIMICRAKDIMELRDRGI